MRRTIVSLLIALSLFWTGWARAESLPAVDPARVGVATDKLAELDAQMRSYVDSSKLAGIALLVARDGKVAHAGMYGKMDLEANKPMRRDAIFRIYSMTKPITGAALMTLYDQGRFDLDDPVAKHLPEFAQVKVYAGTDNGSPKLADLQRPITIRDLMRHTAGLAYGLFIGTPVDEMYRDAKLLDRTQSLDSMIQRLVKIPLASQPGEKWAYSIAVDVQGKLIEKLSGQPLDEFFSARIFQPLGMKDTAFFVPADKLDRMTVNYNKKDDRLVPVDGSTTSQFATRPAFLSGGGGLVSTADDYLRFAQMMLNRGELDGARVLKPETVDLMSRNHLPESLVPIKLGPLPLGNTGFGLDFAVRVGVANGEPAGSLGEYWWGGAASTQFLIAPREKLIVVGMTQFMPATPTFFMDARKQVYAALNEPALAK